MSILEACSINDSIYKPKKRGKVFILGMGNRVRIYGLAIKMIELSRLTVKDKNTLNGYIAIEFVGLRQGGKMIVE